MVIAIVSDLYYDKTVKTKARGALWNAEAGYSRLLIHLWVLVNQTPSWTVDTTHTVWPNGFLGSYDVRPRPFTGAAGL